jgi:hypothetical protein
MSARWLLPGEAATILQMSRSGARWLADTRRIRSIRTASGVRLLSTQDVERFRERRARKKTCLGKREGKRLNKWRGARSSELTAHRLTPRESH